MQALKDKAAEAKKAAENVNLKEVGLKAADAASAAKNKVAPAPAS